MYCPNCVKPPCTKTTCLYEHSLLKIDNKYREDLLCDFCGTATYLLGPNTFRDYTCNFDICEVCYVNLPEEHPLVPFKMSKNVVDHLIQPESEASNSSSELDLPDFPSLSSE